MGNSCTVLTCIDSATAALVFGIPMACYATGYGIGMLVRLVNKMYDAA